MTIYLGDTSLDQTTGQVRILQPPLGFGAVDSCRITNYTPYVLILTNISGVDQSQEYLMPFQQMVYHTKNVGQAPTVQAQGVGTDFSTEEVYIEWSTDGENDFIGVYPTSVVQAPIAPGTTIGFEEGTLVAANGVTGNLPGNAKRKSTTIKNSGVFPVEWSKADSGWGSNPTLAIDPNGNGAGEGLTIDANTTIFFQGVGGDSQVTWWGPVSP